MKSVGVFIVSFLLGVGLIFGFIAWKTQIPKQKLFIPNLTSTTFFSIEKPPTDSIKGTIVSKSGTIFWESRVATEPSELNEIIVVKQGERLITKEKSEIQVNFDQVGNMILSANSDLSFIQTLPSDFVVEQKKGKVEYVLNGITPVTIKIRSAIITKTSGSIQITVTDNDPIVIISILQGTAQIGFNDQDYVSRVFTLREDQIYEYNSDERTVINQKNK